MLTIENILWQAKKKNTHVAVTAAHCPAVLQSVAEAWKENIANFTLIGDEEKIRAIGLDLGISLEWHTIIHQPDATEAAKAAVEQVRQGHANALMKGLVDTSVLLKAVLDKETGIRDGERTLSHLAMFSVPAYHKLLFVTDVAIHIAPNLDAKRQILHNAIEAVQKLGVIAPRAALLAAKEKVDPKMPVTLEYQQLVEEYEEGLFGECFMAGPLALDNAVSEESAAAKGIKNPVAGNADILFCPNIESGNILYKSLAFLGGATGGGAVLGAKCPIILTSRADDAKSKLYSIALGVVVA